MSTEKFPKRIYRHFTFHFALHIARGRTKWHMIKRMCEKYQERPCNSKDVRITFNPTDYAKWTHSYFIMILPITYYASKELKLLLRLVERGFCGSTNIRLQIKTYRHICFCNPTKFNVPILRVINKWLSRKSYGNRFHSPIRES